MATNSSSSCSKLRVLDFGFAAEIDQFAIDAVARRAPAILIEQTAAINAKGSVLPQQLVQFRDDRLNQRGDREGVVHARLRIAHAKFQRVEKRMQPNVPPDFFGVIDAAGLDQQLAVIFVLRKRFERVGNAGARKTLENFQPITFQPGVLPDPKRRVDRERINVRQKIARLIHHVDGRLAIGNADMNVQSENQIRAREQLHVFDDFACNARPR